MVFPLANANNQYSISCRPYVPDTVVQGNKFIQCDSENNGIHRITVHNMDTIREIKRIYNSQLSIRYQLKPDRRLCESNFRMHDYRHSVAGNSLITQHCSDCLRTHAKAIEHAFLTKKIGQKMFTR